MVHNRFCALKRWRSRGGPPAIGSALASGGVWHTKLLAPEFFLLHRPHSVQAWRFMMIGHVSVGVTDLERSRRFYDAALGPLGLVRILDFEGRGSDYGAMAPRSASNSQLPLRRQCYRYWECTSASVHQAAMRSALSTPRRSKSAAATTAVLAFAPTTTPTTTGRSFSILMFIGWRAFVMFRRNRGGLLPHKSLPGDPHGVVFRGTKGRGAG